MVFADPITDTAIALAQPASRAVKRQIQDKRDEDCMLQLLEAAMRQASSELAPQQQPRNEDVAEVAKGAVNVGKTGQVKPARGLKRLVRARPEFLGGYKRHRLQAVGSRAAIDELARWIQLSAQENRATSMQGEAFATQAARNFLDYVCHPVGYLKTTDFCERLSDAWVIQDDKARARHRMVTSLQPPTVLTGAAAAVAALVGWTALEVLRLAGTVATVTVAIAVGILLYRRQRGEATSAQSPAQFVDLRSLLEQTAAFVIDARQMSSLTVEQLKAADGSLQERLKPLMDRLEKQLLPEARTRADVLASHLRRVYDQMLLLQQETASCDSLNLHAATLDLWKTVEGIGRRRRIEVPEVPIVPPPRDSEVQTNVAAESTDRPTVKEGAQS